MEVSDILFTVQGPSAGAILVEWNPYESSQGAVGMWDCHFRVGGAIGTDLQLLNCPKLTGSIDPNCKAASMLMHVTSTASGYFENVWAWVADHDIDASPSLNASSGQIDIYAGRGILIESQGPAWLYGTASEHSALYQYQLSGASNFYLGQMQTETPYYQGGSEAVQPNAKGTFPGDPTYSDCGSDMSCMAAYALRLLDSTDIFIYSAGFYSFFQVRKCKRRELLLQTTNALLELQSRMFDY
jgi:glucan 1,3-beta-glucosidase